MEGGQLDPANVVPPSGPTPPWMRPPTTPPPPADPHLAIVVAVLNATGLGLGYAVLRRWVAMVVCCLTSGVLVFVALPVDPAGIPAGVLYGYLVFLAVVTLHGTYCALYTPKKWPVRPLVGALLSLTLLVVPFGATLWYVETTQQLLLDQLAGADAQVRNAAKKPFDEGKATYHEALATYGYLAREHPSSRAADRLPDRLRTYYQTVGAPYAKKEYCAAVAPLKDLRTVPKAIPREQLGSLASWPEGRLVTSLYECGTDQLGKDESTATTGGALHDLLIMFPRSAEAKKVEPAIKAAIGKAADRLDGSDPCTAVDQLDTLQSQAAELPGKKVGIDDELTADAEKAAAHVESGTYTCGLDQYEDGHFGSARSTMADFAKSYPHNTHTSYAKKVAIAAEIAEHYPAAGRRLPKNASSGSIRVLVLNDSPHSIELLYTGGATGRRSIGGCSSCSPYPTTAMARQFSCSKRSYPGTVLRLPAGTAYLLQKRTDDPDDTPDGFSTKVSRGLAGLCLFSVGY